MAQSDIQSISVGSVAAEHIVQPSPVVAAHDLCDDTVISSTARASQGELPVMRTIYRDWRR